MYRFIYCVFIWSVIGCIIVRLCQERRWRSRRLALWMSSDFAPRNLLQRIPEDVSRWIIQMYLDGAHASVVELMEGCGCHGTEEAQHWSYGGEDSDSDTTGW